MTLILALVLSNAEGQALLSSFSEIVVKNAVDLKQINLVQDEVGVIWKVSDSLFVGQK